MLNTLCIGIAVILGLAGAANGAVMLISPEDWYFAVPGVTTTGPFNQHFLRDIGLIFLLIGAGLLVGAARRRLRPLLWTAVAAWLCGHALFHFWEVAAGICAMSAIPRDFWAVTLPAILATGLALWAIDQSRRGAPTA